MRASPSARAARGVARRIRCALYLRRDRAADALRCRRRSLRSTAARERRWRLAAGRCSALVAAARRRASSRSRWSTGSSTLLVAPRPLPRMDFARRHPAELAHAGRGADDARQRRRASTTLVEALEVRFLANRDAHLHFALLTDFRDARAGDACRTTTRCSRSPRERHRGAEREVRATTATTATASSCSTARAAGTRAKRVWMGYERKRGKLADLNALLRGGGARALLARSSATPTCCRTCATSSRSTPTRSCRATRPGSSSARWRIR